MNRRAFLLATLATTSVTGARAFASPRVLEVYKSPTCGCCNAWIDHMRAAGVAAEPKDLSQEALWALKTRVGLTPELGSCHTALIDGYVIEGHVPASDVTRLLSERPDAIGLIVPGMPIGSPGMEMGDRKEASNTLLILRDGDTRVFQHHA